MLRNQLNDTRENGRVNAESTRSPSKRRSLSDCSPPVLSPSPAFREPEKKRSKDDTSISGSPTTPRRPNMPLRGLSLQMPAGEFSNVYSRMPLSPKLDVADTYGSPVIPRRSRGLDFSRAATNLHHSTLAEQSSPECSSPTISGRAMNIPNRRSGQFSADSPNLSSNLWSTRPTDRSAISSSLGSVNMLGSDSSESSDDDLMDADEIDESLLTTPQIQKLSSIAGFQQQSPGSTWMSGYSPAVSSLMNFQRSRLRNGKNRKLSSSGSGSSMPSQKSRSPPIADGIGGNPFNRELTPGGIQPRRESISWAANQLHISGSESDDGVLKHTLENADGLPNTPGQDRQRGVIKRAVTRRGNMLPKTKGFARIRAALAEESTPIETEVRREANVVRQVRENDMELEPTRYISTSGHSSPSLNPVHGDLGDIPQDDMMADSSNASVSGSFKTHALRNSKGKNFWENFPDEQGHGTPPAFLPQASSGISDELSMDSPFQLSGSLFLTSQASSDQTESQSQMMSTSPNRAITPLPTAADITRKINKRRRDDYDDYDPISFKRRAVSPGMSIHNSPVMQSPMQRDVNPWGTRPPSNSGSEKGVIALESTPAGATRPAGTKRVGLQGMVDTNDGLMKMSIE